ncbi:hypothetical protein NAEGRDRAFT_48860 [Naegleria gruberi]|uniref:Actin n=1 Tax=Naegleria gruberi TaxID=5762 RepID=D2VEC2_NAEGR|nr:uncharacterized protein NAEGRDRAFT_48860 [Naegleria gruberi]EFC44855.1 hypothetical protein NAEGRDRAFT_48860 [Naegleria gruberi]|eukprot:XP_002677599.1 hypothetical protein NAEGRDRAFT_48860 [Naegleria gruberi strain NEG-M]
MSVVDEPLNLVLDCGSSSIQAGFAGDDAPRAVFSSCIGTAKYLPAMICPSQRSTYIGDEAKNHSRRGILNLHYPIQNGIVKNWDLMDILLEFTFFNELKLSQEHIRGSNVLFSDAVMNPNSNSEKLVEYCFEKFEMRGVHKTPAPVLAVYASGRGTALSMCLGDGVIQIQPVFQGYTFAESTLRFNFGGSNMVDYMIHLLKESKGMNLTNQRSIVEEMIKKVCYIALDYDKEYEKTQCSSELDMEYELPDGQVLNLSHERFACPEILFNPTIIGKEIPGIGEIFFNSIAATDNDNRKDLYGNLLIGGGLSLTEGMAERLTKEVVALSPTAMKIKVVAPPERKYSNWIGGSILASLSTFQHMWITNEEYEEAGPCIVHRKCF